MKFLFLLPLYLWLTQLIAVRATEGNNNHVEPPGVGGNQAKSSPTTTAKLNLDASTLFEVRHDQSVFHDVRFIKFTRISDHSKDKKKIIITTLTSCQRLKKERKLFLKTVVFRRKFIIQNDIICSTST